MGRVISWFSCGDASAVASKLILEKHPSAEVIYCDTFAYEHTDNRRFFADVEQWLGVKIKILQSPDYKDIYDVFEKTRWLVGIGGARCTTELKKNLRKAYQLIDDTHVFGFTSDEEHRVERMHRENPELITEFPLIDAKITKKQCHEMVRDAGIELPMMYRLGYKNNNCIGCVKGQSGYWNKIRKDFPTIYNKMALVERQLNAAICKKEYTKDGKRVRERVFLDELPPNVGRYNNEPDIECGVLCVQSSSE